MQCRPKRHPQTFLMWPQGTFSTFVYSQPRSSGSRWRGENLKSWQAGQMTDLSVSFSGFQFFSFPSGLDLPKSWHRPLTVPTTATTQQPSSVTSERPTLSSTLARSRPFPPPACSCPPVATLSHTRRLRRQFSRISVARREQLVECVQKSSIKCAKNGSVCTERLRRHLSQGDQAGRPPEKVFEFLNFLCRKQSVSATVNH